MRTRIFTIAVLLASFSVQAQQTNYDRIEQMRQYQEQQARIEEQRREQEALRRAQEEQRQADFRREQKDRWSNTGR